MRYPLDVWCYEIGQAMPTRFQRVTLPLLDKFTLQCGAVQSSKDFSQEDTPATAKLPTGIAYVNRAIVCMMSYIDLVLASEATAMAPIPGWVTTFQRVSDIVASSPQSSAQKRSVLSGVLKGDIELQIAEASHQSGTTIAQLKTWGRSGDVVERHGQVDILFNDADLALIDVAALLHFRCASRNPGSPGGYS